MFCSLIVTGFLILCLLVIVIVQDKRNTKLHTMLDNTQRRLYAIEQDRDAAQKDLEAVNLARCERYGKDDG